MRNARIKADGAGYYHCMSRIIERRMILEDSEKERLLTLMHAHWPLSEGWRFSLHELLRCRVRYLLRAALAPLEAPFSGRIGIEESKATMM